MLIELLVLGGMCAAGIAGLAAGLTAGALLERKRKELEGVTPPGTVEARFDYVCHPRHLHVHLARDLAVLDQGDVIAVDLTITRLTGWRSLRDDRTTFRRIRCKVRDLPSAMLELTHDSDGLFKTKPWGEGLAKWGDDDSPLQFSFVGLLYNQEREEEIEEVDEAARAAVEEVEGLLKQHRARVSKKGGVRLHPEGRKVGTEGRKR